MAAAGSYKLAGFLQKKGAKGMIKGWKKRFFILFPDNIIRYYDEFGFINLNDVEQVRPSATIDHMFEVVTPTRVYELQAGSAEEQESWVSTLKAAMANESAGPAAASSSSTDSSAEVVCSILVLSSLFLPSVCSVWMYLYVQLFHQLFRCVYISVYVSSSSFFVPSFVSSSHRNGCEVR